jgi:hypothetical protein
LLKVRLSLYLILEFEIVESALESVLISEFEIVESALESVLIFGVRNC